jgi:hypothetical protein
MVWTAKAVNDFLKNVTGGDAHVEQGYEGGKAKRDDFASHKEYVKVLNRTFGYFCIDTYRPGMKFWGKTPKAAARAAGFTILN